MSIIPAGSHKIFTIQLLLIQGDERVKKSQKKIRQVVEEKKVIFRKY